MKTNKIQSLWIALKSVIATVTLTFVAYYHAKRGTREDVALLEWYFEDASQGKDHIGLDVVALTKVPEADYPHLGFHLASNSHLLASNYPIHRIWQVNQDNFEGDNSVNLDQGGVKLFIWRQQMNMRIDVLSEVQWICLNNIAQGKKLADLGDDITVYILEDFMKRGWLVDFEVCQK